ncbi:spore coat protein U domain-containing protein, partial [Acinetobacter sp. YH16031]
MRIMSKKKSPFLSSKNLTLMSGLFLGLMITGESQAAKCSISSTSLDFGEVSPALSTTSTNITLRCDPRSIMKTNIRVCLTATSWLYNDTTRYIYTNI